jgi:hypothetical protein
VTGSKATFDGTAKVNKIKGYTFKVFVEDSKSSEKKDKFSITIKDKNGATIYAKESLLKKGNIEVHR